METENKTLIEQSYIARKSSFFGLFHHLIYTPTNSLFLCGCISMSRLTTAR